MNIARDCGYYCDCTAGGGGHLEKFLQMTHRAQFIGIDWDPEAIAYARQRLLCFGTRVSLFQDNYIQLDLILDHLKINEINGVIFDFGVSFHQIASDRRGFSFDRDCPLKMNMAPDNPSLSECLEQADKFEIMQVLKDYGDVRNYRRVGAEIFEHRKELRSTGALRDLVIKNTPKRYHIKNLRRVFQALRIWVNKELENVESGLIRAFARLAPDGRLITIAYHSGEDRIVKQQFRKWHQEGQGRQLNRKVIRPSA
ncbi:16S rRNA (cytosine(1402)-N(4))-methyltransferase, partial [candidate division WOR-3 bacterium RBG_13_43_14]